MKTSNKLITPTFILCLFLGVLGVHCFYVGRPGRGLLMLITLGGYGIWAFIDLIILAGRNFKDGNGRVLTNW
ncbi:MAG: TM2 domain-containing protein [Hydrotalea sp.]|nr:TM2 domain-containing protein [Hydrotalea sp.]